MATKLPKTKLLPLWLTPAELKRIRLSYNLRTDQMAAELGLSDAAYRKLETARLPLGKLHERAVEGFIAYMDTAR